MLPRGADSLDEAHAAIELWEFYKRRRLDLTQRLVVEVLMATQEDGTWAAQTTGREMARQNGKGDEIEVVELWGLTQRHERILHTVHEAVLLTTQAQERLLSVLEGHPDLRRLTRRPHKGVGQQMIPMRNGGVIWYRTRTGGGARGVDEVDRVVIDEAQHAEPEHLAALAPTMFMAANPQMNALGSAGIANKSAWWWQIRKAALAGDDDGFGYVGHTAELVEFDGKNVKQHPVDVEDRSLWRVANPALAAGRGNGESWFAGELRNLGPALFAREHLCVWDPPPSDGAAEGAFPVDVWQAVCRDDPQSGKPTALVVDVAPEDRWGAIAAASGDVVKLLMHRQGPGLGWLVAEANRLSAEWGIPVVFQGKGPAAHLADRLTHSKPLEFDVVADACAAFANAVAECRVTVRQDDALDTAVRGAERRTVGDRWVWDRRTADVTPLNVVSVAYAEASTSSTGPMFAYA